MSQFGQSLTMKKRALGGLYRNGQPYPHSHSTMIVRIRLPMSVEDQKNSDHAWFRKNRSVFVTYPWSGLLNKLKEYVLNYPSKGTDLLWNLS